MPQKQTFTNVTPIPQQQTFSNVTPIGDSQPSVWDVLTQPTDKTDAEYGRYRGAAGVAGATIKGLDDVARGTQGAIEGLYNTVRHPIDTVKGIAALPSQAAQVPSAIKAINESPDPTGTYLNVAQDTASQAAGQALTGIATEGIASVAKTAGPYVGPVGKALVKGYAKKVIPGEVGEAMKAVKAAKAADANAFPGTTSPTEPTATPEQLNPSLNSSARTLPGQVSPEVVKPASPATAAPIPPRSGLALPPAPAGAELGDLPASAAKPAAKSGEALGQVKRGSIAQQFGKDPGASQPTIPTEVRQATGLRTGGQVPPPEPSDALGSIPVKRGQLADQIQQPQTSAPVPRGSIKQMMGDLGPQLRKSMDVPPPPDPKLPIYQRGSLAAAVQEGVPDMPQGHTAYQSSALKSSMYDPDAQEFHARYSSGGDTTHVFGDVSPEEAEAFNQAKSKGTAMQQIKNSHPLVAKVINGKRMPTLKAAQ